MAISLLSIFNASRVIAVFVSSDAILLGKVAVDESQPVSRGRLPANRRRPRRTRKNSGQIGQACANSQRDFAASVAAIQKRIGGRVGVYVLDTQSQLERAFNARERFAMCSTFKLLLAAHVLRSVDAGTLTLDHRLPLRS
jgi:beta-lactamase class A